MPQLDFFMFLTTTFTIVVYSVIFWTLSHYFFSLINYFNQIILVFTSFGFARDVLYFYYFYWVLNIYVKNVVNVYFSYQFLINRHVYFLYSGNESESV